MGEILTKDPIFESLRSSPMSETFAYRLAGHWNCKAGTSSQSWMATQGSQTENVSHQGLMVRARKHFSGFLCDSKTTTTSQRWEVCSPNLSVTVSLSQILKLGSSKHCRHRNSPLSMLPPDPTSSDTYSVPLQSSGGAYNKAQVLFENDNFVVDIQERDLKVAGAMSGNLEFSKEHAEHHRGNAQHRVLGFWSDDRQFSVERFHRFFSSYWNSTARIVHRHQKFMIISFESEEEMVNTLKNGPYNIEGGLLCLNRWSEVYRLGRITVTKVLAKIRLFNIPEELMNSTAGERLAHFIGDVDHVAFEKDTNKNTKHLKARIWIDPTKTLIPGFFLKSSNDCQVWVQCAYARVWKICRRCGVIGHPSSRCYLVEDQEAEDFVYKCILQRFWHSGKDAVSAMDHKAVANFVFQASASNPNRKRKSMRRSLTELKHFRKKVKPNPKRKRKADDSVLDLEVSSKRLKEQEREAIGKKAFRARSYHYFFTSKKMQKKINYWGKVGDERQLWQSTEGEAFQGYGSTVKSFRRLKRARFIMTKDDVMQPPPKKARYHWWKTSLEADSHQGNVIRSDAGQNYAKRTSSVLDQGMIEVLVTKKRKTCTPGVQWIVIEHPLKKSKVVAQVGVAGISGRKRFHRAIESDESGEPLPKRYKLVGGGNTAEGFSMVVPKQPSQSS